MGNYSENSADTLRRGDKANAFSMWHLDYFTSIPSQPTQFSPTFSSILHTPHTMAILLSPPLSHLYPLYSTQFPHSYSNIMVFSFLFTLSTNKNTNDFLGSLVFTYIEKTLSISTWFRQQPSVDACWAILLCPSFLWYSSRTSDPSWTLIQIVYDVSCLLSIRLQSNPSIWSDKWQVYLL